MALPASFLDELRARTPLPAVIGRRVRLARSGRQWKGCCPFHGEKTPSFYVYEDGHYHCFGCGAHGDAIGFVMQSEGAGFMEAVERLAAEAGLEVPKASPEPPKPSANATTSARCWIWPIRDEPHQQAVLVERLQLVDRRPPQPEEGDERVCLICPRVTGRRHAVGQAVQRSLGDGAVQLGRGGGEAQRQRGAVRHGGERRQGDLTVDLEHVGSELSRRRACAAGGRLAVGSGVSAPGWDPSRRRRRQTSSLTQAICLPAVETASMRASASVNRRADATWSWSCRRSSSCSRWARRCSSTRMSVRRAVALSREARSAYSGRSGA